MRGIILAGGTGSRLKPLTLVTNKHLLPIYNKPMIYYPLKTLVDAGIKDILIISGPGHAGHFVNLLGSGKEFGVRISYEIQDEAGGIAQAIGLAEGFVDKEPFAVILGDNIFEDDIKEHVNNFNTLNSQQKCKIFLKEVGLKAAKRFGTATVMGDKVMFVEEKPQIPKSNLAMAGLYMFDSNVFDIIRNLKPSARGELEVTDAIAEYVKNGSCYFSVLKGFWSDAGTFESMNRASNLVRSREVVEEDYWSDNDDFAEVFEFPSKDDNTEKVIEKLSQLSKKQSEILDYISKKK